MPIQTSCKNCIFATYNEEGETQIGCHLNKLELFEKNGAKIIEAYDEEKEFFVVDGRICMWCRGEDWGKKHAEKSWEECARIEMTLPYQAIIVNNTNIKDLEDTIESLYTQEVPPQHITVIRGTHTLLRPLDIINIFNNKESVHKTIKWRIQNMTQEEDKFFNHVDAVVKSIIFPYYAVFNSGFKVPPHWFKAIDHKVNDKLLRFGIILFEHGLVVPTAVHKFVQGNNVKSITEKLIESKQEDIIFNMRDILDES